MLPALCLGGREEAFVTIAAALEKPRGNLCCNHPSVRSGNIELLPSCVHHMTKVCYLVILSSLKEDVGEGIVARSSLGKEGG